jgi:hypothetical protein
MPCFFVHPCLLGEVMAGFCCNEENYLAIWIGLSGGPVGLWIPAQMMMMGTDTASASESASNVHMASGPG